MICIRLQELGRQPNNKEKHGRFGKIELINFLLIDKTNKNKYTLLSSNPNKLISIACKNSSVGEEWKSRILIITKHPNKRFIFLPL